MQMDLKFFCYLVYLVNLLCFHISGAATVYNQKSNYLVVLHNVKCISVIIHTSLFFIYHGMFIKYGTGVGWGFGLRNYFISLKTCCNTSTNKDNHSQHMLYIMQCQQLFYLLNSLKK